METTGNDGDLSAPDPDLQAELDRLVERLREASAGGRGRARPSCDRASILEALWRIGQSAAASGNTQIALLVLQAIERSVPADGPDGADATLTALLDSLAGDDGRAFAVAARGQVRQGTWRLVFTADSFDDGETADYEISGYYEHFAHEGRVAILRALLASGEEGLGLGELTQSAGMSSPEECSAHLEALQRDALVESRRDRWRLPDAGVGWVAVPVAFALLRRQVGPRTLEA